MMVTPGAVFGGPLVATAAMAAMVTVFGVQTLTVVMAATVVTPHWLVGLLALQASPAWRPMVEPAEAAAAAAAEIG
jgi:hypothetical protein